MKRDELFLKVKSEHSDWSDEQIWTQVSVMLSAEETVTEKGPNTNFTEELLKTVLQKAKNWLQYNLPEIFAKVVDLFDSLIDRLPKWAKKGLQFVFKMIVYYFRGEDYFEA